MKKSSYGGLTVIFIICILAYSLGAICGMCHVGEDFSKEIMPATLSTTTDTISVIDEKNFEAENISVKLYIPKPIVKTTVKNNTTNTTNSSFNKTNYNNSSNHP
jgi:hypothetical protein